MRDQALYELLKAFTSDTAAALRGERAAGAEVPFEIEETETRRGRPPLYCYRALTGQFIQNRMGLLSGLSSYPPAARALASRDRTHVYLRMRGAERIPEPERELADAVLLSFLARVFSDRSDFDLDSSRFEAAYAELEQTLLDGQAVATVIAPITGLGLEERSWQVELGQGLSLVRGERLKEAPTEAVWEADEEPRVMAVLKVTQDHGHSLPVGLAQRRFRRLLTALRLFERGRYGLGALGWARIEFGTWHPVALGTGPAGLSGGTGEPSRPWPGSPARMVLPARQEDELRGFCNLMDRRLPAVEAGAFASPEVAWALGRFDMGWERPTPLEGLSDHLSALRALLEPEGPSSGQLPGRLALICASPEERAALAERVAAAIALERSVITGTAGHDPDVDGLAAEMAEHLRALLRDVLCGHLSADLVGVADGLLAEELTGAPA
ncbi:MAG TPA: hypothetical protein VE983_02225 [Solirubrobacteraceae bacterium]|nr:hypothetical protein [Solirubrobacteraceae bacterium]